MADVEIRLSKLFLCKRKVRFFHWNPPDKISIGCSSDPESIPLFLGADVLVNCNILAANFPRTHARFHKKGLSTKVSFPSSSRVVGIHGSSRGVWFYSIQGLFRIIFEFYSREEQFDCLGTLSNLWKQRIADAPLKGEIVIDIGFCKTSIRGVNTSTTIELPEIPEHSTTKAIPENYQTASDSFKCCTSEPTKDKEAKASISMLMGNEKVSELVRVLTEVFDTKIDTGNYELDSTKLVEYLTSIVKEYKLTLITCNTLEVGSQFVSEQRGLWVISRWLGREFHYVRDKIKEQATKFKSKHIDNIHDLPPAECVIDEVFLPLMKSFLQMWMLGSEENMDQTCNKSISTSKDVLPKHYFPVIQLILELANQTLVSGVAHVLYSRLVQAESV